MSIDLYKSYLYSTGNYYDSRIVYLQSGVERRINNWQLKLAVFSGVLGFLILLLSFVPAIVYKTVYGKNISQVLRMPVTNFDLVMEETGDKPKDVYQPPQDPNLSLENKLIIKAIGVDTQINEAEANDYEQALRKGVWRVPDFGTPFQRTLPTILTAHRFGYIFWSNLFRHTNSFYNLPKLKTGDTVEIDWKQRKYIYEIYSESTGEEITDYTADLILYTCRDLNSNVRIFKYGRLLKI